MNFRNIGLVLSREYSTRVHKKSFLVTTFIVPVIFLICFGALGLIIGLSHDKAQTVNVLDESGIVMPTLKDGRLATYVDMTGYDLDDLKASLNDDDADVILHVFPLDSAAMTVAVETFSAKPLTMDLEELFQSKVEDAVEDYRIESYGIPDLKEVVQNLKPDISVSTYTLKEGGGEKETSSTVFMIVSVVLTMIIFMFISMFSGMVMSGVIEEKSNKVVEVLTSSLKSTELMFGKIIGVAGVALTQFLLWVVLIGVIVFALMQFGVFNSLLNNPAAIQQVASVGGMTAIPGADISSLTDAAAFDESAAVVSEGVDSGSAETDIAESGSVEGTEAAESGAADVEVSVSGLAEEVEAAESGTDSELVAIFATLKDLNYGQIILSFIVFFLLGYLLYASLFGAIGSAVDNEGETNQLQLPVTSPLMIGFFVAFYVFQAPDSGLAVFCSLFPLTSPIVMMARIPFGVPGWQIALSIVLLLLTFVFCAWLSAKIFRIGLLTSGKKTTFKDLWKWIRMK